MPSSQHIVFKIFLRIEVFVTCDLVQFGPQLLLPEQRCNYLYYIIFQSITSPNLFPFKSEKNCNFAVWTLRAAIGQNVPV